MAFKQAWVDSSLGSTVNVTVSVDPGDILVAWLVEDTNPAGDSVNPSNWPSGFTHVHAIDTFADGQVLSVGIKVADGSEGALTFGFPSGNDCIGGVAAFSGRDTTTPQDVAAVEVSIDSAGASPWTVSAGLTPVTDGCDLVAVMGSDITSSQDVVHSFSGGGLTWTVAADQWSGDFENVAVGYAVQPAAGAITVTGTGTRSGATAGRAMILLALRPAAGGGGDVTGTGALAAQAATVAGAGTGESTGTAALAAQAAELAGAGVGRSSGLGAVVAGPAVVAGAGAAAWRATGTLGAQAATVAGLAATGSAGVGALAAGAALVVGVGSVSVDTVLGRGVLLAQAAELVGVGERSGGEMATFNIGIVPVKAPADTSAPGTVPIVVTAPGPNVVPVKFIADFEAGVVPVRIEAQGGTGIVPVSDVDA